MKKSQKVLVTGGAGFIGSHTAEELIRKGYDVVVLDDLSGGFRENIPTQATFVEGSILDLDLLTRLFETHRFRYVYHLAAYAAEGLSHFIRHYNYENNLIGSIHLINLSIKYKIERFVFTSSIAVYGSQPSPLSEKLSPLPEDPYGVAKAAVEMDLRCAHEMFGLNSTIFRPHNVYGERQNIGDRYRNVIGIFMNQIMKNEPLTIFGDGLQTRAFSYIDDVVHPMVQCLEVSKTENQTYNVGSDLPVTVKDLAREVLKAMGKDSSVRHLEARNEVVHAYSDHSAIKKIFGADLPETNLQTGLKNMAEWALKRGPRKTHLFMKIDVDEKMPPSWLKEIEENRKQGAYRA